MYTNDKNQSMYELQDTCLKITQRKLMELQWAKLYFELNLILFGIWNAVLVWDSVRVTGQQLDQIQFAYLLEIPEQ